MRPPHTRPQYAQLQLTELEMDTLQTCLENSLHAIDTGTFRMINVGSDVASVIVGDLLNRCYTLQARQQPPFIYPIYGQNSAELIVAATVIARVKQVGEEYHPESADSDSDSDSDTESGVDHDVVDTEAVVSLDDKIRGKTPPGVLSGITVGGKPINE